MNNQKYLAVKPMLVPFITESEDSIRVGGYQAGITREIFVDDVETFFSLMKDLDGKNSYSSLETKYSINEEDMKSILNSLKKSGVLYKNDNSEFNFSDEEQEYYSRNLNFFAWIDVDGKYENYWEVQDKLKASKVLVLGSGGTGGHCVECLSRLGVGNISVIDFDKVELSNLNRQNFEYADIDKLKTEALVKKIKKINPFISIDSFTRKINSIEDIEIAGSNFDIVINCIDKPINNPDILDEYSIKYNIPWVLGGYASTIMNHGIYGKSEVKYSDYFKLSRKNDHSARSVDENTFWTWDNAIISPIAVISGYISALYAMYYLTNLKELDFGKIQHIDFFNIQNMDDFSYILGIGEK